MFNPPPPFDPCTQTDYASWYDMISSIIGFVTASTQLVSSLRNSPCCFVDPVRITDVTGDGEKNSLEVYNITDFPWFLLELNDIQEEKIPLKYYLFKDVPLIQFPKYDIVPGEPNFEPRSITLTDTMDFGDVIPRSTSELQSQNQSSFNSISHGTKSPEPQKSDISAKSSYFQEYTDSEQTIDSANLQENFEVIEEKDEVVIKTSESKSFIINSPVNYLSNEIIPNPNDNTIEESQDSEEAKVCTIYETCNAEPAVQDDLIVECRVEEMVVIQSNYPFNGKNVENKEEGVTANCEMPKEIVLPDYYDYDMSVRDILERSADNELENMKECRKQYCELIYKSKRIQEKSKELNLKPKNKRHNNIVSDVLSHKVNEIKGSVERLVTTKSKPCAISSKGITGIERDSEKNEINKKEIRKNKKYVQHYEDTRANIKKPDVSPVPGEINFIQNYNLPKWKKVKPEDDKYANKPIINNNKNTKFVNSKKSNHKLKDVSGFSGNYSEEPIDYVTKNIVNCLNLQKKLRKVIQNKQKSVASARSRPQSQEMRERSNELKNTSQANIVVLQVKAATPNGKKPVEKKSPSVDGVKNLASINKNVLQKTQITSKKNVTKTTSNKDKSSISGFSDTMDIVKNRDKSPDTKSCLKYGKKNSSEPIKTCILSEDQCKIANPKRPISSPVSTKVRIIPKLTLIKDQTLKLTAKKTVKEASDLLRNAEEKILRPITTTKLPSASEFKRERSSGVK